MSGGVAHAPMDAICAHVARHLGPIESVFHELVSPDVHVDVHIVPPTAERPCITLFTTGMSALPMTVPEGEEARRFAEVLIHLPPDWPLLQEDFEDENHYWPIRILKVLARLPHGERTWLGPGHTIGDVDPPVPFADRTPFAGMLLLEPEEEAFASLRLDGGTIRFLEVVPLYVEELRLALEKGIDELGRAFDRAGVSRIVTPERTNAVTGASGSARTLRRPRPFGVARAAQHRAPRWPILIASALLIASASAADVVLPLWYGMNVRVVPPLLTALLVVAMVRGRGWARWIAAALCAVSFVVLPAVPADQPDLAYVVFVGTVFARAAALALLLLPPWRGSRPARG